MKYATVAESVSIGFALVESSCHLTGRELESLAAKAKTYAKDHGKNRVASYVDPTLKNLDAEKAHNPQ